MKCTVPLALALLAGQALGNSVAPPRDLAVMSPHGAMRAEARVFGGWKQRIEVYRGLDATPVWVAPPAASEAYLTQIVVSDDGAVLAEDRSGVFRVFSAAGLPGQTFKLDDFLSGSETWKYGKLFESRRISSFEDHLRSGSW